MSCKISKKSTHHIACTDTGLKMCCEPQTLTLKPLQRKKRKRIRTRVFGKHRGSHHSPYTGWSADRIDELFYCSPKRANFSVLRNSLVIFEQARLVTGNPRALETRFSYTVKVSENCGSTRKVRNFGQN